MIIVPVYNERKNILALVARIRQVIPQIPILFIDDNSPDGTAEEIKSLQKTDQNLHLLERSGKLGFASAYLDGMRMAITQYNPEFIVTMDADLSHPPEKLPQLIELSRKGLIGVGSRYVRGGGFKNLSWDRRILSRLGNLYARLTTKLPLSDITSGFMAIPAHYMKSLDLGKIKNTGYAFLMEFKIALQNLGAKFSEVPIIFEERKEGTSKISSSIVREGVIYPAKVFFRQQGQPQNLYAWLIFFISLAVYIATLPHTFFFGDSAEFIASVISMGIPHPPGYPGYLILAKPFTWLPFGSMEFRIGLFSALSASTCLAVLYFLFLRIAKNKFIGFCVALIFGFSPIFWSQAIMVKVYAPALLIFFLILLLLYKYWETGKIHYVLLSLFLWGLAITVHQLTVLFLPILFLVIFFRGEFQFTIKTVIIGLLLFILGLSVFLYLPLRGRSDSNFNFSNIFHVSSPSDPVGFINYVKRSDYQDFGLGFDFENKINFTRSFGTSLMGQFGWLTLFAVFGIIKLYLSDKKSFLILGSIFLLNSFGIILLRNSPWGLENEYIYSFYYLPAYAVVILGIGFGFVWIYELIESRLPKKVLSVLVLLFLILPVVFFQRNLKNNNLSNFTYADEYTKRILENLPKDSVFLVQYENAAADTMLFGLHFQQIAKKIRPDVSVLSVSDIYPLMDLDNAAHIRYELLKYVLQTPDYNSRAIYTSYIADNLSPDNNWFSSSNGLVYKFYETPPTQFSNDSINLTMDYLKDLDILESDIYGRALLCQYFYSQAAWFAENQMGDLASENIISGIKYDDRLEVDNSSIRIHRHKVLNQ